MSIGVEVNYEGTEEGAQKLDALTGRLTQLQGAEERGAQSTRRMEQALQGEAQAATTTARTLQTSLIPATRTLDETTRAAQVTAGQTAQRMGQMTSAVGAMANASRGLSPRIADVAGQISAMGAAVALTATTMGPFGPVVAGVTVVLGALSLAMNQAADDTEALERAVVRAIPSLDEMIDRIQRVERERQRTERINRGEGTAEEQFAAAQIQGRRVGRARQRVSSLESALRREYDGGGQNERTDSRDVMRLNAELERARADLAEAQAESQRLGRLAIGRQIAADTEAQVERDVRRSREAQRQRPRRGGGRRGPDEGERLEEEMERAEEAAVRIVEEERAARARAHDERMEAHDEFQRIRDESHEREKDKIQEEAELRAEALEKAKEGERALQAEREEQMREAASTIESTLGSIASAYIDAMGEAIEGQKSAEEAALDATKSVLKGIGEQMVGIGLKEAIEGFANVVSAPPIAATKIPAGIALIGLGVGLGAAGAAIPSGASKGGGAERPKRDRDSSGGDSGPRTIIYNVNTPLAPATTTNQFARALNRQSRGTGFPTRLRS